MKSMIVGIPSNLPHHKIYQRCCCPKRNKNTPPTLFFTPSSRSTRPCNVFANGAYHSYLKAEDQTEVVSLHNILDGSVVRLLKYQNRNSSEKSSGGTMSDTEILGNYEWLIRPDMLKPNTKSWNFRYDWKYKAKECFE